MLAPGAWATHGACEGTVPMCKGCKRGETYHCVAGEILLGEAREKCGGGGGAGVCEPAANTTARLFAHWRAVHGVHGGQHVAPHHAAQVLVHGRDVAEADLAKHFLPRPVHCLATGPATCRIAALTVTVRESIGTHAGRHGAQERVRVHDADTVSHGGCSRDQGVFDGVQAYLRTGA